MINKVTTKGFVYNYLVLPSFKIGLMGANYYYKLNNKGRNFN